MGISEQAITARMLFGDKFSADDAASLATIDLLVQRDIFCKFPSGCGRILDSRKAALVQCSTRPDVDPTSDDPDDWGSDVVFCEDHAIEAGELLAEIALDPDNDRLPDWVVTRVRKATELVAKMKAARA